MLIATTMRSWRRVFQIVLVHGVLQIAPSFIWPAIICRR
jgi:hypothetical protein